MNECVIELRLGNDEVVRFDRTIDKDGAYYTGGSGTWSLTDADGLEIDAGTVDYVAGFDGRFELTVPKATTETLTVDAEYTLTVGLTAGGDEATWELTVAAVKRTRTRDGSCSTTSC